jgi:hypothetical protein
MKFIRPTYILKKIEQMDKITLAVTNVAVAQPFQKFEK